MLVCQSCLPVREQNGRPGSFADELLEHRRNRGVHIDLPLRCIALQGCVYLAPPRFLIVLDGGAVRGNVLDVDSDGFSKS